jgi:uncharacterized lipoprotein YddW (UPF0748 family)
LSDPNAIHPRVHSARALTALAFVATVAGLACGGDEHPSQEPAPPEGIEVDAPIAGAKAGPVGPRRGLWVLAEGSQRVLESADRIETLLVDAERIAATDLFVQVYRGGRAWYDAELADAAPYEKLLKTTGGDGLAMLIAGAHARGLRVHAWVNVLSLSHNAKAPIIETLGRDSILTDRRGRSLLDYPKFEVPQPDRAYYRMGTPGLSLDPGAAGVREYLVATFGELLERYPELDGLHLDYVRHPGVLPFVPGSRFGVGLDFGYGEGSRAKFQRDTGLAAPREGNMVNLTRWDDWRRDQVTELVAAIHERVREQGPDIELSAAVIAYADRAYLTLAQDWLRWIEDDLLDFAVPMIYTLDNRLLRYQAERFAGKHAERTWAGLGTWLFARRPDGAFAQLEIAESAGLAHHALFSYDSMVDAREAGLLDRFAPQPASPADPDAVPNGN